MAGRGAINVEEFIRQKVAAFRFWKKTRLGKRTQRWDFQFTVTTYNILSQIAVENHRYLYRHCHSAFLQEDYRTSRLLPEILHCRSDIICLQEVEQHLYDNRIKKVFDSHGFGSIFKRRTGLKSDGCAILWRKNKFHFVDKCEVEFTTDACDTMDRDNIGLIAVLRPAHSKSKNTLLHVATTHLLYNPKRGDIKFFQLRWLLAELDKMCLKEVVDGSRRYHPIVLCGDFNIEPFSPLYNFIESGELDVTDIRAGDLAGQSSGKGKGRKLTRSDLVMDELGISDASRYEKILVKPSALNTLVSLSGEQVPPPPADRKPIDPKILAVVKEHKDTRWVPYLLYLGYRELAEELLENQGGSSQHESKLFSHDINFVPAYKYRHKNQKTIPVSSMTGNDFNTVDHIFYNVKEKKSIQSFREDQLRLLSIYTLMSEQEIRELGGLPNAYLGSDHTCLMAQFALHKL